MNAYIARPRGRFAGRMLQDKKRRAHTARVARQRWLAAVWMTTLWLAGQLPPAVAQPAPGVCGPSQLGSPCGAGGPATLALGQGPGLSIGNPVHAATGAKYQRDTDLPALPGPLGLELVRHYNSFDTRDGPWGVGWRASYDTRLFRVGGLIQIVQADGSRVDFSAPDGDAGLCAPSDPAHGELVLASATPAGPAYLWRWRNGRRLEFDQQGWLRAIVAPTGHRLVIERAQSVAAGGRIERVRDPQGRELVWHYDETGRVVAVATPAGLVRYHHEGAMLAEAAYPDGHRRSYRYEARHQAGAAHRLTGIVAGRPDGSRQRLGSWVYDKRGRVVRMQYAGQGGDRQLRLAYEHIEGTSAGARAVRVTDADGHVTQLQTRIVGGRHVWDSASDQTCPACEPARTDGLHDAWGRLGRYHGMTIVRDALGRIVDINQGEVRVSWWRDTALLRELVFPSVVPGRWQRIAITWRDNGVEGGLPVRVTHTGWRPVSAGEAAAQSVLESIERTFDLAWRMTERGHELTAIHGPPVMPPAARALPDDAGWSGLQALRDDFGQVVQWSSDATGMESREYSAAGNLTARRYANGGVHRYSHDAGGRLREVIMSAPGVPEMKVQIHGTTHERIVDNGVEREYRRHDAAGRLRERRVLRRDEAGEGGKVAAGHGAWSYREAYEYDDEGRLIWHWLPEGGALHYRWRGGTRLDGVAWIDAWGRRRELLAALSVVGRTGHPAYADGYRYGNGIRMRGILRDGRLAMLAHLDGDTPLWAQARTYDAQGRVAVERTRHHDRPVTVTRLAYDAGSKLVVADVTDVTGRPAPHATGSARAHRAWHPDGALRAGASYDAQGAARPIAAASAFQRDASGLPLRIGSRRLRYGADRRLKAVYEGDTRLVRYRHNAWGERIHREDQAGASHFLYSQRRLAAEWRHTRQGAGVVRRYVYAQGVPVAMIEYGQPRALRPSGLPQHGSMTPAPARDEDRVLAIHADALGAPRVVTDEAGHVLWQADYTAWGAAIVHGEGPDPGLRLPGQWFDAATGWHDNYLRTYDPAAGHYLEPDPLGPGALLNLALPAGWRAATSPYGYAAHQPLRYVDPLGLVLFAFDGTREDLVTATNVYEMALLYQDSDAAAKGLAEFHYRPGPGTPARVTVDAALALSAADIVAGQWSALLQVLAGYQATPDAATIDLVGYSRGAALARHFGNLLAGATRNGRFWHWQEGTGAVTACADLRFMGLFDSVAQFGVLGSANDAYDFSIAPDWSAVAHAVALHERRGLFPLLSTAQVDGSLPGNVLEAPFVGAHGDIGGGLIERRDDGGETGDLSDLTLQWMVRQAGAAGVELARLPMRKRAIDDPVLHDLRPPNLRRAGALADGRDAPPAWLSSDRVVTTADGSRLARYQADHATVGRARRDEVDAFIHRMAGWLDSDDPVVGMVDLAAYEAWLAASAM